MRKLISRAALPIVCLAFPLISPARVAASDYTRMVHGILFLLGVVGGSGLILGIATSGILVWIYRRKWAWFLVPVFAAGWMGLMLGIISLWNEYDYPGRSPEPPVPLPAGPDTDTTE